MLPDMMLVAIGMAMAYRLRGEARCALTWLGDGATSRGDFHEAMNWAGVQRLPVIFVLENNQFAFSTPTRTQYAVDPVERAAGYGFPGVGVDGNDVEAVFEATREARERALAGGGPTLIEARRCGCTGTRPTTTCATSRPSSSTTGAAGTRSPRRRGAWSGLGVDVEAPARRGRGRDRRGYGRGAGACRCPTAGTARRGRLLRAGGRGARGMALSGGAGMPEMTYLAGDL